MILLFAPYVDGECLLLQAQNSVRVRLLLNGALLHLHAVDFCHLMPFKAYLSQKVDSGTFGTKQWQLLMPFRLLYFAWRGIYPLPAYTFFLTCHFWVCT